MILIKTRYGERDQLKCPIANRGEDEETPDTLIPPSQRFDIDLDKLARSIEYDQTRLPQVIRDYERHGEGRHKSPETLCAISNELHYICEIEELDQIRRLGKRNKGIKAEVEDPRISEEEGVVYPGNGAGV
jgi:hypothetical protein